MVLDRSIAPTPFPFQDIQIPGLEKKILSNGNPLYIVNCGEQPIVRFEMIWEAGNKFETKTGQSYFTIKMLSEGTHSFSSNEIAEKFASIGYFIEFSQGSERAMITLNGLTKHLNKALEILSDLVLNPIFPEKEFLNLKTVSKQHLSVNLEKTSYLASVVFKENVFGSNHYIGKSLSMADIDLINRADLLQFYNDFIKNKAFKIFAAGKIEKTEIDLINQFSSIFINELTIYGEEPTITAQYDGKQLVIEKEGSLQSSIRIGRRMIDRKHEDYYPLKVCNTILGGYFGSRLMKNIREEKGYTYGISSSHLPIPNYGYLLIGTDVKREFTQNTIDEIHKEISKLQTELVGNQELEVVKNFIIGDFAGSLNTPFDIADKHKVAINEGLPAGYYNDFVQNVLSVTNQQVLEMAKKYFSKESLFEVVVGGK